MICFVLYLSLFEATNIFTCNFFGILFVCFAVVPHITNAIQEWVERVAKVPVDGLEEEPDVCIVEV